MSGRWEEKLSEMSFRSTLSVGNFYDSRYSPVQVFRLFFFCLVFSFSAVVCLSDAILATVGGKLPILESFDDKTYVLILTYVL